MMICADGTGASRRGLLHGTGYALVASAALACWGASSAEARITRIEITSVDSPTFEGRTFGQVGAYEKLRGKVYGEVVRKYVEEAIRSDVLR